MLGQFTSGIFFHFSQAIGVFSYLFPLTIILLILFLIYGYLLIKGKDIRPQYNSYEIGYAIGTPIFISVIGSAFYDTLSIIASSSVLIILTAYFGFLIFKFYKGKRYRLFTLSAGGAILLLSLVLTFVAGMSIANDWI